MKRPDRRRGQTRQALQSGNPLADRFAGMPMIEADSSAWFGEGKEIEAEGRNLRKALQAWAKKTFPEGMTVRNADQGWEVQVSPRGIKRNPALTKGESSHA